MTTSPALGDSVPEWDVADRMRKALRYSGVGVQEMADYLGVARNTVSTWINGRITPTQQTQRLWAMRTGVPYEWIRTGRLGSGGGPSHSVAPTEPYLHGLPSLRNQLTTPAINPLYGELAA